VLAKDYADGQSQLRKSRLESYESILEALVKEPLSLSNLSLETHMSQPILVQRLMSLIQKGLIEERPTQKTRVYAITEKGSNVIRVLDFPKYLRKIKGNIRAVEEAIQIIPELLDQNKDTSKSTE
jgi:DNA-binding HxlR family transcriptional regulator